MTCKVILDYTLQYSTYKVALINDRCIGIFLRLMQVAILVYITGYSIYYKRGYQDFYGLSSSVLVKVKGIAVSNRSDIHRQIWDIADMVVPSQEMNGIFITTNAIETINQTQGTCPEDPTVENAICFEDNHCVKNKPLHLGNGVMTGRCIPTTNNRKTCEIKAWCPIENDTIILDDKPLLKEVLHFTILIKNTIIFDELNVQRSNLIDWTNGIMNKKCIYDPKDKVLRYCPIFNISSLIGPINETELSKMLTYGGIIRVIITWNCNLDFDKQNCKPEYSFAILYSNYGDYSKGWNFRYANYYEINNREYRILFKVFGLRILIEVRGKAGKFSPATLSMNIGSGLALLSIATIVCDLLITNFFPNKDKYYQYKYETYEEKRNQDKLGMYDLNDDV